MANPMTGKDVANVLSTYVNCMNLDSSDFVEAVLRDHPTLQQNLMRVIMKLVKSWADLESSHRYDLRSEATIKAAKQIVDNWDDIGPYLPFV